MHPFSNPWKHQQGVDKECTGNEWVNDLRYYPKTRNFTVWQFLKYFQIIIIDCKIKNLLPIIQLLKNF